MTNIRLIKRRLRSTKNISQITRAMEMVAASKMKKAQEKAVLGKPYAEKIYQATWELASHGQKKYHPLLSLGNPSGRLLAILISTNKGLCGSLNANLFRFVYQWLKETQDVDFVCLGNKGQSFVLRAAKDLIADFSAKTPFSENVPAITSVLVEGFLSGTYKEIYLVYNAFLTPLKQVPTKKIILPISFLTYEEAPELKFSEFLIEPSISDVLESLLPHYLENQVRAAILEAEACEHSARMMAMKNATEAASDLMAELTLIYNKARQEGITNEIADMVTARMAVEL